MSAFPRLSAAASAAGGSALAAAARAVALRPARKPLHPRGELLNGRIWRDGSAVATGVAWLDEPGVDDVVVRRSRAIGLPSRLPDIHGLAIRLHSDGGDADVLLATTGQGRVARFVLTPTRQPSGRTLTTLLPYDTDTGPLVLSAVSASDDTYELSWARPRGEWQRFGELRLARRSDQAEISFDPVRNQVDGLRQYAWVERLREPAYATARRSR